MNRNKLPRVLDEWLDVREFPYSPTIDKNEPEYLTDDEIYSAALVLLGDIETDLWEYDGCGDYSKADRTTIRRFVSREKASHKAIDSSVWYEKRRMFS